MSQNHPEITASAQSIYQRELGHKKIAAALLPVFGLVIAAAAAACFALSSPAAVQLWIMAAALLLYAASYSTLICGLWTIGMIPQAGIATYVFSLMALWRIIPNIEPAWLRISAAALFAAAGAVVVFFLAILCVMLLGSVSPLRQGEYTLLVLGCKLKNGKPGRMLKRRLDKAAELMKKNAQLCCIVTGGRASDQPCAESEAMRDYLVEAGIPQTRIFSEEKSATTYENFIFSREIISQNRLPERVGIVSDHFHQYRAGRIARTAGIKSFPVGCRTAWYLAVQFWMRDMLCIVERLLKGHW